ncbi:MAG TPA: hypothetical protein VG319_04545 [Polyangia bacterium]|nr:hypothetical protein [Polyangia bacterium]
MASADCGGGTPVCDGATHACRACAADAECGGTTPVCSAGACVACAAGKPGACAAAQKVCDTTSSTCVECVASADCSGTRPICDSGTHTCRICLTSADCDPRFPVCLSTGACAVCTPTDTARCGAGNPLCDTSGGGGVCVSCLGNADCGGTTPVCSAATHACVGCTADGAPSCPDPARPACQKAGPLAGACTECSATNQAQCGGAQPQCLVAIGLCGCATDAACGAASSGLICSGPNGFCVPGCGPSHNGCAANATCVGVSAGVGHCATAGGCTADADCASLLPRCDTTESVDTCVQCLLDKDCPPPFVCATGTQTCVECTATNQSACRADLGGARCVSGDSCGCAMDADCGATTSGRVCDATTARCVPGCRATGGNGCPTSLLCTSAGNDIGVCQPRPVVTDGGADGPIDAPSSTDAAEGGAIDGPAGDLPSDAVVGADAPVDVSLIDGAGGTSDSGGAGAGGGAGYGAGGGYIAGGGCRCDAGGSGRSPATFLTLALAIVGAVVRRRRRR